MGLAAQQIKELAALGIDIKDVTDKLLREGVESFGKSFESLMNGIKTKREALLAEVKR